MANKKNLERLISNNTNSNIINEETYKIIAGQTINTIADALSNSLGYYGSTTVVENNTLDSFVTKDGYNILKRMKFDGTISMSILKFISNISFELVKEVGDGSTSSVLVARKLYELLQEELDNGDLEHYSRKEISDVLKKLVGEISELVKEKATPITEENFDVLKDIAAVSNNNDDKLGEMVYNIYKEIGKEGFIYPEVSSTGEDYYEITHGLETSYGYEDPVFANDRNGFDLKFKDAHVVMIDGVLEKNDKIDDLFVVNLIQKVFVDMGKPLVIIAHSFDPEIVNLVKTNVLANRHRGGMHATQPQLEVALTRFSKDRAEEYKDLAAFLGTELIPKQWEDPEKFYVDFVEPLETGKFNEIIRPRYLGSCKTLNMDANGAQYIEGAGIGTDKVEGRIDLINKELEYLSTRIAENNDMREFSLEKRRNNLKGNIARLFVGGTSSSDAEARKFLIEDSIFACRSALNHGYISGGNLMISKVIPEIINDKDNTSLESILLNIIQESSNTVFKTVLNNYNNDETKTVEVLDECLSNDMIYNIKTKRYEKDDETTIINSAMTDIKILEASISIIGLLVLSNQYLTATPIDNY